MNQDEYIALMYKKLKSDITPEELDLIDRYILEDERHAQVFEEIRQSWNGQEFPHAIDSKLEFEQLKSRITATSVEKNKVRFLNWRSLSIAASLILVMGFFIWQQNKDIDYKEFAALDTVKEVTLKDGSLVSINQGSKIKIPSNFGEANREVLLEGEAYFDVKKNDDLVFEIKVDDMMVSVLGTAFNIKETIESITVMVDRGKVKVEDTQKNEEQILEARETTTYNKTMNAFIDEKIYNPNASYWKTKRLRFTQRTVTSAMNEIGSLFDKEIIVDDLAFAECEISGSFNAPSLISLLDSLKDQFGFEYSMSDTAVILKGGICR